MNRTYRATFTVTVEITVPDEAVTRVLNNEDGWREEFYNLDERGVVEMLARCCGILGARLERLDGWADLDLPVAASVTYDMEEYERIPSETEGATKR